MSMNECTLANMPQLTANSVWIPTPLRQSKWPEFVTRSVVKRMAHLIYRMETNPNLTTAIGAKWVLANLLRLNTQHVLWDYIKPFEERLLEAVTNYEEHCGVVDENHFAHMLALAGYTPERILFGEPLHFVGGSCFDGSPHLEVARTISYGMWRQGYD